MQFMLNAHGEECDTKARAITTWHEYHTANGGRTKRGGEGCSLCGGGGDIVLLPMAKRT